MSKYINRHIYKINHEIFLKPVKAETHLKQAQSV